MIRNPIFKTILAIIAFAALVAAAAATTSSLPLAREASSRAAWDRATQAYQQRKYDQAIQFYQQVASEGAQSADLYFNMGNAYQGLGKKGMAALMYEKALAIAPRDREARGNLKLVRAGIKGPQADGAFFLFRPISWACSRLTASEWVVVLSTLYFIATFFALVWTLRREGGIRMWARRLCLLTSTFTILAASFFTTRYLDAKNNHYGVIVQPNAIVRSAPGPDEPEYFEAPEGERLRVEEAEVRGWLKVKRTSDGRIGYLPENALQKI